MATELRAGVWQLPLRGVNAYLVDDDGLLTLVDAGMPWQAGAIRGHLADAGVSMRDVDRVLVTHYDLDHVGGLPSLLDDADPDVAVYCGERDADLLAGRAKPPLGNRKGLFQRFVGLFVGTPDRSVTAVTDGDHIGGFEAIHAPGHTPGHTVFVHESLEAALLGDLVRESGGRLEPSPWPLSHDTDAVRRSIEKVVERAPSFEAACVGHGDPIRRGGRDELARLAERSR